MIMTRRWKNSIQAISCMYTYAVVGRCPYIILHSFRQSLSQLGHSHNVYDEEGKKWYIATPKITSIVIAIATSVSCRKCLTRLPGQWSIQNCITTTKLFDICWTLKIGATSLRSRTHIHDLTVATVCCIQDIYMGHRAPITLSLTHSLGMYICWSNQNKLRWNGFHATYSRSSPLPLTQIEADDSFQQLGGHYWLGDDLVHPAGDERRYVFR